MSLLKDEEAEARREAGWALGCSQPGKCFCHPQGDVGGEGKVQRGAVGINWTLRVPLCTPPPQGPKPALAAPPLQLLTTGALGSWNRSRLPLYFYNLWALAQALCL